MRFPREILVFAFALLAAFTFYFSTPLWGAAQAPDAAAQAPDAAPLASWADNNTRQRIIDFVTSATTAGNPDFVPPVERIAVVDLDGTLIPEQPKPFMLAYAWHRYQTARSAEGEGERGEAGSGPAFESTDLVAATLAKGDLDTALTLNVRQTLEILAAGIARDEPDLLAKDVAAWLDQPCTDQREPGRRRRDLAYQPMLELLDYLRANQFKVFLVTGSEQEFARAVGMELFNIPPEQVIGSQLRYKLEEKSGKISISREPRFAEMNQGALKAINISSRIGQTPIIAVGNSDGDLEMLKLTTQAQKRSGKNLGIIIHHTDAAREFAYDRENGSSKLRRALEQAKANGWLVVDMQEDWLHIYAHLPLQQLTVHVYGLEDARAKGQGSLNPPEKTPQLD